MLIGPAGPATVRSSTRSSGCSGRRGRARNRWRAASPPSWCDNGRGTASSTFSRMGSIPGFSSAASSKRGMEVPYAPRLVAGAWVVAGWAALGYGVFLTVLALRSPPGAELTGHWALQPACKASMALLLTLAPAEDAGVWERRGVFAVLLLCGRGG